MYSLSDISKNTKIQWLIIKIDSDIDKKLENKLEIYKNLEIKIEIYKNLEI